MLNSLKIASQLSRLVGVWYTDPADSPGLQKRGHFVLNFKRSGQLIKTTVNGKSETREELLFTISSPGMLTVADINSGTNIIPFTIQKRALTLFYPNGAMRFLKS